MSGVLAFLLIIGIGGLLGVLLRYHEKYILKEIESESNELAKQQVEQSQAIDERVDNMAESELDDKL